MSRRVQVVVLSALTVLSIVFFVGVLAGWWPYEWWRAFGLGQR